MRPALERTGLGGTGSRGPKSLPTRRPQQLTFFALRDCLRTAQAMDHGRQASRLRGESLSRVGPETHSTPSGPTDMRDFFGADGQVWDML